MQIVDEHLRLRLEDMILITERGHENMSAFVPVEIDAIEKFMKEAGLSDATLKFRPVSAETVGAECQAGTFAITCSPSA